MNRLETRLRICGRFLFRYLSTEGADVLFRIVSGHGDVEFSIL